MINTYIVIKESVDDLIESLKKHKNERSYYYNIRSMNPSNMNPIDRASRFIFLNKTCFNGLYRENSKGEFNVPYGKYKNPKIFDENNLRLISKFLNENKIDICNKDYREIVSLADKGDLIYFDPPYHPISKTSSFTRYTKVDFKEKDQIELAEIFKHLDKKGCFLILSNSNTEFIKKLYSGFNIKEVSANRFINSKVDRKKKEYVELIIKNF